MSAYAAVLKPARLALMLFACSTAATLATVIGLHHYRNRSELAIAQAEKKLAETRRTIGAQRTDLDAIARLSARYRSLVQDGFIGEAPRDDWVARLEALYRDTQLPPTLKYTLLPPQPMQTPPVDGPLSYRNGVLQHDLELELSGIHEGEFLDFADRLQTDWQAPYRIETCRMARTGNALAGLEIRCTVRLFSLPQNGGGRNAAPVEPMR